MNKLIYLKELILDLSNSFNQQILPNTLPNSLIKLTFGNEFNNGNKELGDALSNLINLKELEFGNNFNQQILPNTLPSSLIKLTFGKYFNQKILEDTLPNSLNKLTFGDKFTNGEDNIDFKKLFNIIRKINNLICYIKSKRCII